jgi:heme/copper-type cytochrome/quinol oxidase subunit 1
MTLWLVAMALFIVSSLLGGINYVTTVINLRTTGSTIKSYLIQSQKKLEIKRLMEDK